MRAILAVALTTALPMIIGQRWIAGPVVMRWSLGGVVGIVLLAWGGLVGGLAGSPPVGAAVALIIGWTCGPRARWAPAGGAASAPFNRAHLAVMALGLVMMAMSLVRPVPSWDAWFTWSLKSKALAAAHSFNAPVFLSPAYNWSSQDYPTLLPSWQALAYIASGDLSISWPLQFQQAWLWTIGGLALISLMSVRNYWGFLLPLAWLASPQVVWQSMQGYADIPMAVPFLLGTIVLATAPRDRRAHVVGGVLLAGAALTKSEGPPLVAMVLLCLLIRSRPSLVLGVGPAIVALAMMPWLLFTHLHGLTNHMVTGPVVKSFLTGTHLPELPQVFWTMGSAMFSPFRWGILVPGCLIGALLGRAIDARLALAAVLQLAVFAAVYNAAGSNQGITLDDFMRSNVDRILIAPLGTLVLAVALGLRRSGTASQDQPPEGFRGIGRGDQE